MLLGTSKMMYAICDRALVHLAKGCGESLQTK
jgi:hypothetical protein